MTGNQEPLASAFLGRDFDENLSSSTYKSSIRIASENARQINGPVTTTFTGPIDKVEAHLADGKKVFFICSLKHVSWTNVS